MKQVRFGKVETRVYQVGASDHPAVSSGLAIGLTWRLVAEEKFEIPQYTIQERRLLAFRRVTWLHPRIRRQALLEMGHTQDELNDYKSRIIAMQRSRLASLPPSHMLAQLPTFFARSVRRSFKKKLHITSSIRDHTHDTLHTHSVRGLLPNDEMQRQDLSKREAAAIIIPSSSQPSPTSPPPSFLCAVSCA